MTGPKKKTSSLTVLNDLLFLIGIFSAKSVYCNTVSMTFNTAENTNTLVLVIGNGKF